MTWHLDPSEVRTSSLASSSGKRHRSARDSRKLDERAITMRMEHAPSGLFVEGVIPEGHYSRKEMGRLYDELSARLFRELEAKVARHLRIPGR